MYYQRPIQYRILDAFCRHWRLFAATLATIVILLVAFVALRPKTYSSQFTVVTNNQALANPLASTSGQVDWNAMTETVNHFQTLVATKEFDQTALNSTAVKLAAPLNFDDEDSLLNMQKGVSSAPQGNDAFTVSMTYNNATDAGLIPQALIYAFIKRNAEEKSAAYTQQVAFIQGEVDSYRDALKDSEAKLADFKADNIGHLPSQQEAAEGQLTNLQQQIERDITSLSENQQQQAGLQADLTATPKTVIAQQVAGQSPIDQELNSVQQQISTALTTKTLEHPQVKALLARQKALQAEAAKVDSAAGGNSNITGTYTRPNPEYDNLNNQLMLAKIAGTGLTAQISAEKKQLTSTAAGVAKVPGEERQLANLQRDYQADVDNYQLFSQKLTESQLDEQINLRQNLSEYSVYMTAPPMLASSKSKTLVLLLGGVIIALLVASGLVVLVESMDRSFRDPLDLQRTLGVPVLAMLPESADLHVADSRNRPQLGGPTEPRKRLGFGRSVRQLTGPDNERIAAAVEPKSPVITDAAIPPTTAADMPSAAPQPGAYRPLPAQSSGAGSAAV